MRAVVNSSPLEVFKQRLKLLNLLEMLQDDFLLKATAWTTR